MDSFTIIAIAVLTFALVGTVRQMRAKKRIELEAAWWRAVLADRYPTDGDAK